MLNIIFLILSIISLITCGAGLPAETDDLEVREYSIYLPNGFNAGYWSYTDWCEDQSLVHGMEIKYEPAQDIDNTAVNGIKLYCSNMDHHDTGYITSKEGHKGNWMGMETCDNGFVNGMRARVLEYQGIFDDDVAVTNLQLHCTSGDIITGVPDYKFPLGEWGDWVMCPHNTTVCAMMIKFEDPYVGDDTATTDLMLECCYPDYED